MSCYSSEVENTITDQKQLDELKEKVTKVYNLKREFALNFNDRDQVLLPNIFVSDEVKDAIVYMFLKLSVLGHVSSYEQQITILTDQISILDDGTVIIPAIEKAGQVITDHATQTVKSANTEELFFLFQKIGGEYLLSDIKIIKPIFPIGTKYSSNSILNFLPKESDREKRALLDEQGMQMYEEYKIFDSFFKKSITKEQFNQQIKYLYRDSDTTAPNAQKLPLTLNKVAVVNYATTWTEEGTSNPYYASYNPAYTHFDSDCTNYISQCLRAGGRSFEGILSTGCDSWWYNNQNTASISDDTYSYAWVNANGFYQYVTSCSSKFVTCQNPQSIHNSSGGSVNADLFFIDFETNDDVDHILIVTSTFVVGAYKYIFLSAHTTNRLNYDIANYEGLMITNPSMSMPSIRLIN